MLPSSNVDLAHMAKGINETTKMYITRQTKNARLDYK